MVDVCCFAAPNNDAIASAPALTPRDLHASLSRFKAEALADLKLDTSTGGMAIKPAIVSVAYGDTPTLSHSARSAAAVPGRGHASHYTSCDFDLINDVDLAAQVIFPRHLHLIEIIFPCHLAFF